MPKDWSPGAPSTAIAKQVIEDGRQFCRHWIGLIGGVLMRSKARSRDRARDHPELLASLLELMEASLLRRAADDAWPARSAS